MINTQTPPHKQGREYDRYASASVREYDVEGSPIVAVMIDEDDLGARRVELRREDILVVRRDRDAVVRWLRPDDVRVAAGLPDWASLVLEELDLAGEVL